jgi:hypothetical protein
MPEVVLASQAAKLLPVTEVHRPERASSHVRLALGQSWAAVVAESERVTVV